MIKHINSMILFNVSFENIGKLDNVNIYNPTPFQIFIEANFALRRFLYDTLSVLLGGYRLSTQEMVTQDILYEEYGLNKYILGIEAIDNNGYLNRFIFNDDVNREPSLIYSITTEKSNNTGWKSSLIWNDKELITNNNITSVMTHTSPVIFLEPEKMPNSFFHDIQHIDIQEIFICQNIKKTAALIAKSFNEERI